MSLIGGWSVPFDPLYESSPATLAHTQLLAEHPQLLLVLPVQSRGRYAAMRVPSTPALLASDCEFNVPSGLAASVRKFLQPYNSPVASLTDAVPTRTCLDTVFMMEYSLKRACR